MLVGGSCYDLSADSSSPFAVDTSALPGGGLAPGQFLLISRLGGVFPVPQDCCDDVSDLGPQAGSFAEDTRITQTWALFGAAEANVTDALSVRAELRYTSEKKGVTNTAGFDAEETFTFWTPRFSVDYTTDLGLLYASIARGAKAGGFNAQFGIPADLEDFDPEFNWTYEIGAKTDWLDGRLRVNVAAFFIDLSNIQITTQVGMTDPLFVVRNAGDGSSKGIELEVTARPVEPVTLTFGYALADSTFGDGAQDFSLRNVPPVPDVDISGQQFPRASRHTLNGSATYQAPLFDNWDLYGRVSGRYESPQKGFTSDLLEIIGSRFIADAQLGLKQENFEIIAYVQNLTGDETPLIAATTLSLADFTRTTTRAAPRPRRFGVTATLRY